MSPLDEMRQMQHDCEPAALVRLPLELLSRLEITAEELVSIALDIQLRIRAGKMNWNRPWAREARDGDRASQLLKELESKS